MLSVIICTRNKDISPEQHQNIESSIGVDSEVVVIDNSDNSESLFSAYNKGVRRAKGDILCFMHDDVMFRTENWGNIVEKHFEEDPTLGMMGFAGAHFLPSMPMYWDESPYISEYDLTTRNGQTEECFFLEHFEDKPTIEVAAVDGLCFFIRKELFNQIRFDETTFKGFHLYDMDISMQVRKVGYKVCVCRDILVEHFYNYSPTKAGYEVFESNLELFYNKWSDSFPLAVGLEGLTNGMVAQLDKYVKQKMELERSYNGIRQSKAYRLGKTILRPFNV